MTTLADLEVEREIYSGILSLYRVTPSMAFVIFALNNGAEGEYHREISNAGRLLTCYLESRIQFAM